MKRSAFVVIALALLVFPIAAQQPQGRPRSEVQLVEATVDQLQHALRTGLLGPGPIRCGLVPSALTPIRKVLKPILPQKMRRVPSSEASSDWPRWPENEIWRRTSSATAGSCRIASESSRASASERVPSRYSSIRR